jgi:hypothetical protein
MDGWAVIGAFGTGLILAAVAIVFGGWVLSVLWVWFIVPIFNAPVLGLVPAIGIRLIVGYLTVDLAAARKRDEGGYWEKFCKWPLVGMIFSGFILGVGWIIHQFM